MFQIKEKEKSFVVKFDPSVMAHAPNSKFRAKDYGSMEAAGEAAEVYGASVVELNNHSKNLSDIIHSNPILAAGKVNVHVENVTNKTGVVGVHVHRTEKDGPILGYRSSFNIDGKQYRGYFSAAKHGMERAFFLAAQHRIAAMNTNIPILVNTL